MNDLLQEEKFNFLYKSAINYHNSKKYSAAAENYIKSGQLLLEIAENCPKLLKEAKIERANKLISIGNSLLNQIKIDVKSNEVDNKTNCKTVQDTEIKEWTPTITPEIYFDDIAGLDSVKEAITVRMINPIKYPDIYRVYNKKSGGGILLYGPSGTGKTTIARAIACEVGAKFYAVKGSDIISKWVGESEKNISSLFQTARLNDLSIIFIDEMDSLFYQRGNDANNDKRVNEFLQQIDGIIGQSQNVLILGATNRPWDIDSAALRSGRFSQKIFIPLPDKDSRKFLFNKYIANIPVEKDLDIDKLVEYSEGYSGADIEELCDRAIINPLNQATQTGQIIKVSMEDFEEAFKKVYPTVSIEEMKQFEEYNQSIGQKTGNLELSNELSCRLLEQYIKLDFNQRPQINLEFNRKVKGPVFVRIKGVDYNTETNNEIKYTTEPIFVRNSGLYDVKVFAEDEIFDLAIEFVKGIQDYDMGI